MRDSINYNLKYFIMKMSGTKPMKNTMRKKSPLKFDGVIAASLATKEGRASYEASRPKGEGFTARAARAKGGNDAKAKLTKDNTVKVGGMLRVSKARAAEVAAKKEAAKTGATTTKKPANLRDIAKSILKNPKGATKGTASASDKSGAGAAKPRSGMKGAIDAARAKKEATTVKTGGKSSTSGLKGLANKVKEKVAEKQALKAKQPTQATKPAPSAGGKPSNPNAPSPTPKSVAKAPTDAKSAAVKPTASASKGAPAASAVLQLKKRRR